jgi:hypothetical protein
MIEVRFRAAKKKKEYSHEDAKNHKERNLVKLRVLEP